MDNSARIEELERKFNENPRRYFAPLANEFRKAGNIQRAIAICREFVPQQSGHMSGHIVFGQALFEEGNYVEARAVFSTALDLDPENLLALRHLGDIARMTGDNAAAISWYRRVLEVDPRNEDAAALLATLTASAPAALTAALAAYGPPAPVEAPAAAGSGASGWATINPEQTRDLPLESISSPASDQSDSAPVAADVTLPVTPMEPDAVLAGIEEDAHAPPPAPEPEAQLAASPAPPPPPPPAPVVPASSFPSPQPFVTETMAQLYLQQGHRKEALDVYRQLVQLRPHDKGLRDKVAELEQEPVATPSEPAVRTAREFFAAFATRVFGAPVAAPAPAAPPPVEAVREEPAPAPPEPPAVVAEPVVMEPAITQPVTIVPPAPDIPPPPPPAPTPAVGEATPPNVEVFVPETYDPSVAEIDTVTSEREHYQVDEYGASSLDSVPSAAQRSTDFEYDQTMDLGNLSGSTEYHDTSYTFEPSMPTPSMPTPSGAAPVPADMPHADAHADAHAEDSQPITPPPAPAPTPARRAQTGSVSVLFPGMAVPGIDEAAAATLAGAFGGTSPSQPISVPVPAVRQAPSEISLDSIFGGDEVAVEAELFTSWLAGLKKK